MNDDARVPVIIALDYKVGGVFSWAVRLKKAFSAHPRYRVMLMEIAKAASPCEEFDLRISEVDGAYDVLSRFPGAIVVPNYFFPLCMVCADLTAEGRNIRLLGMCHSRREVECILPLTWNEPVIGQFVAVSKECRHDLVSHIPHRETEITMLPYGIPIPPQTNRAYQTRPIRLIYAGRLLQNQKRVMDFVPLVQALLRDEVDFRFDVLGDGEDRAALEAAMAACPHGGRVRFLPPVPPDRMDAVWPEHDVFVQVSDYEGTSISMLEAMSHGTVPVLTDAGSGIEGNVLPGQNGFVVDVGDMTAMAGVIADLARDPKRLERVGQAAREKAKEFSMESYAKKFAAVLDRTLAGPLRFWPWGHPQAWRLDQDASRRREIARLKADVDRYRTGLACVLNKPPLRAYRAIRRWLGGRDSEALHRDP